MTPKTKEVCLRIRKMRESKGLSQQNVADKLKITGGAYAKIERGETDPYLSRLFSIAEIFEVDIFDLIREPAVKIPADVQSQLNSLTTMVDMLNREVIALRKPAK